MSVEKSYTEARAHLDKLLDQVIDDCETVIIKRKGKPDVALIAADELEELRKAAELLRSPRDAERLLRAYNRAIAQTEPPITVEQLRKEVDLAPKAGQARPAF